MNDKALYESTLKHPDVEEPIDLWFYRPCGFRLAKVAARLHVTPNQITVASIFLGVACGVLCYPTQRWINLMGLVMLVLADICDSADGQLARLTGQYSRLGRILDGAAGDFWFVAIYVALVLRLTPDWGIWCWILAAAAGACHSLQAAMADYYRQFHLFVVKGRRGSELDDARQVADEYAALRLADDPIYKVFMWFYRNYTRQQEALTPAMQRLRSYFRKSFADRPLPEALATRLRAESRPLMPIANALTFNCRALTLAATVLVGLPWLYWVVELVVGNALLLYMIVRHERMCRSALAVGESL